MSGESRRARRSVAVATALMVTAGLAGALLAGASGARAEPSTADIQWAQTILKEKGFDIGGRANGQMTPQTHAALGSFQRSVGLPATGQLDQATVARMMGEREKKTVPTMGSLSKSQIGQTPREKEFVPRAAPTQRVDSGNETVGGMAQFGAAPPSPAASSAAVSSPASGPAPARTAAASAASPPVTVASAIPSPVPPRSSASAPSAATPAVDGPVLQAAPRGAVSATTAAGQPAPLVESAAGGGMPGWVAGGLRYGVMGLLAATLGGIGFAWWRSGRAAPPAGLPSDHALRETRVEPSFGTGRRKELTAAGPGLTADIRRR